MLSQLVSETTKTDGGEKVYGEPAESAHRILLEKESDVVERDKSRAWGSDAQAMGEGSNTTQNTAL